MDSFFGSSNTKTITEKPDNDFDFINKSLEESTKKITETKKEKSIFDGIKDPNNTQNTNSFIKVTDTKKDNKLDRFNFDSISSNSNNSSIKTNNINFNLNSIQQNTFNFNEPQKSFPNIDFSKTTSNKKDMNMLDSLLNDLPNSQNNFDFAPNNFKNTQNFNLGVKSDPKEDFYNLDFLKNEKTNTKNTGVDPFMNLLKK